MKRDIIKRKIKIRYDRILICIFLILIIGFIAFKYFNCNLTNIYVSGNTYLNDQTIIELANLENYPKMIEINSDVITNKLMKNQFINKVEINKKLTEVHIKIDEAKPIYYDMTLNKTVLSNSKEVDEEYNVPILINYIPDTILKDFIQAISNVNEEVLTKISEIKYDPNIDSERFLLTMTDGNYVYININRFKLINNYLTIISNFKDQKGIIYLDSGSHFEVFKETKAK